MEVAQAVPYKVEGGKDIPHEIEPDEKVIDDVFDLSYTDYHFFQEKFLDKAHMNFVCAQSEDGPMALSIVRNEDGDYTALLRTCDYNQRIDVSATNVKTPFLRNLFRMGPSTANYVKAVSPTLPTSRFKKVNKPDLPPDLLAFEEKQTIKGFKFGLLYCAPNQVREDELFANEHGSPEFEEFLDFLGERVELKGWNRFRAGLDVTNGSTGDHSIFLEFNNNEIMFHVSTLLPHNELDKQKLEKKRHIGNDLVVIIFQEGDQVYRPTTLSSRQVQVVFLIKPEMINDERHYRLAIVRRAEVPPFGPLLPEEPVFKPDPEFHDFLFRKLLNAEKAAYTAEIIAAKLRRTRTALLEDLAQRHLSS